MDERTLSDLPLTSPARPAAGDAMPGAARSAGLRSTLATAQDFIARLLHGDGPIILALALLPVLIHLPELLGIVHANALGYTGALGTFTPGFIGGQPTIDPNIGFTSQALGAQAAQQWLSGHVPWWNPYEGIGAPLAGEMQSAAFFPLTLLLIAPWGQTVFHLCLQVIAGVATYYLLRQLRLSRTASLTGAVLFEFNGVFAWLANAVVNPIPFLPLLLLGVERAFLSARAEAADAAEARPAGLRRELVSGWKWIAVALALSLLAGFPEVAYLDGILAALWVVARMAILRGWGARLRFALKLGTGFLIGLALAAPLLVAFAAYLPVANLVEHAQGTATLDLPALSLAQFLHPYIFGNIYQFQSPALFGLFISWGNIGGYLGATVAFLALMGVFGRRERALRITLLVWIALAVGRSVGAGPFAALVNKIPLMDSVAVYRYVNASWVMAAIVLSAFAIDDWRGGQRDKVKAILCAAGVLGVLSLGSIWLALPELRDLMQMTKRYTVVSIAIEWGAILFLLATLLYGRDRTATAPSPAAAANIRGARGLIRAAQARPQALLMSLTVMALSIGYYFYPILANPRSVTIDHAAISYLQAHSGYSRFFTLGPFAPNYGSYFGVASINHNDVPVPQVWVDYVQAHLDPYAVPVLFINLPRDPSLPTLADEVATHITAYEAVGVKYVLASPGQQPFARLPAAQRPALVYRDTVMWIYQLPAPAPLFSAEGNACQVKSVSWTEASASCASATTLIYRSLTDASWHATVNGHAAPITPYDSAFQQIALPAGRSQVTFWYEPPHATLALIAAALAALALVGALLVSRVASWRWRGARHGQSVR